MIYNSTLKKEDMDLERNVIFEEIDMCADEPEEIVHDLIMEAAYGDNGIGRTILGTKDTLSGIDSEKMCNYIDTHYTSQNSVIAMSGNFDESIFDLLEEYFGKRVLSNNKLPDVISEYKGRTLIKRKDSEQVQLVAGFKGIDSLDERVYSLLVFNNIFGEGMSSRLFQNIREKRGLVYSIYAYHSAYKNSGMFNIAAGMNPNNLDVVSELIAKEITEIKRDKITKEELLRSKEQLKGNYILSYENTGSRMQGAGRSLLIGKPIVSPEEVLEKIDAITLSDVSEIIDEVLNPENLSVAVVGNISEDREIPIIIS